LGRAEEEGVVRVDIRIQGATVFDGSGAPPVEAGVAIGGDRILAIGEEAKGAASGGEAKGIHRLRRVHRFHEDKIRKESA